jgi:hypothetical protein
MSRTNVLFSDVLSNLSKWNVITGTWITDNGSLKGTSATGGEGLIWAGNTTWTNYSFTARLDIANSGEASLVVRYKDPANFYWLGLGCWGHKYSISKMVNRTCQELASFGSASEIEANGSYLVTAIVINDVLQFFVNNIKVLQVKDNSIRDGAIGFRNWDSMMKVNQPIVRSAIHWLGWNIETVDSTSEINSTSLALDPNGNPHISYNASSDSSGLLKYAMWSPRSGWSITVVDDTWPGIGKFSSLAMDSNGYPHIIYCAYTDYLKTALYLKHAEWHPGTGWISNIVDRLSVEVTTSLALDSEGNPHISYNSSGVLKYAKWTPQSGWSIENVDSNIKYGTTSLALDSSDKPHIAYNGKYAKRRNIPSWVIETVQQVPGNASVGSSLLALDSNDYPNICSMVFLPSADNPSFIDYAKFNGSVWLKGGILGGACGIHSLALDSTGNPHVTYMKDSSPVPGATGIALLNYAGWNSDVGHWTSLIVDSTTGEAKSSMDLDSNDNPHISYCSSKKKDLKYAHLPPIF